MIQSWSISQKVYASEKETPKNKNSKQIKLFLCFSVGWSKSNNSCKSLQKLFNLQSLWLLSLSSFQSPALAWAPIRSIGCRILIAWLGRCKLTFLTLHSACAKPEPFSYKPVYLKRWGYKQTLFVDLDSPQCYLLPDSVANCLIKIPPFSFLPKSQQRGLPLGGTKPLRSTR